MDTDADRNLHGHTYCDAAPYGHAYRDGDAYHHFYRHACPERSRRARTDSDACPAYGHADASVSVPD